MKKEDLKIKNVVELRDESRYIKTCVEGYEFVICDNICVTSTLIFPLNEFDDDLKGSSRKFDIMKVYEDYTLKKVLWERKEKPKLTEDEKAILRNLPKECKYIARDREGNLYVHILSPRKEWGQWLSKGSIESLVVYNHLFNFIKWEDELPTLIEDLLKE